MQLDFNILLLTGLNLIFLSFTIYVYKDINDHYNNIQKTCYHIKESIDRLKKITNKIEIIKKETNSPQN